MTIPTGDRTRRRPAPLWDMPVTVALLLGGLYSTTVGVAQAPDSASTFDTYLTGAGIGHYTQVPLAVGAAYAGALSELLALVLAIGFSVPRLRAGRRAFWIPLVCAAIAIVLGVTFSLIALFGDPAYANYFFAGFRRS